MYAINIYHPFDSLDEIKVQKHILKVYLLKDTPSILKITIHKN